MYPGFSPKVPRTRGTLGQFWVVEYLNIPIKTGKHIRTILIPNTIPIGASIVKNMKPDYNYEIVLAIIKNIYIF